MTAQPSDLLRALLRRHYRGQRVPAAIDGRFIQILRQNNTFDDWPIEKLAADREAFFRTCDAPHGGASRSPDGASPAAPTRIAALPRRNTIFRSEPRSQAAIKAAVAQDNDF